MSTSHRSVVNTVLLKSRPLAQPGGLLKNVPRLMRSGLLVQAKAECQQVLKATPDHAEAHYLLGLIATRLNCHGDAARHIAESLRLNPANPVGHNNLGVIFKRAGRRDEAIACFVEAIRQQHDYVEAHHNLGNALHRAGRPQEALASFDKAIGLNPRFAASHNSRGNLLVELQRHEEALACFDQAIAIQPQYPEAFNNKANALLGLGRPEEALWNADKSIRLESSNPKAHNNRGNALAQLKRFAAALESFDNAIRIDPHDATAYANKGGVLLGLKRYEEAVVQFDKALCLDAGLLEAHENCAQAATGARQYQVAAEHYARLFALAPDYPFVKGNLLHAQMLCCDWSAFDELKTAIDADQARSLPAAEPFGYQGIADSELDLLNCARTFSEREFPVRQGVPVPQGPAADGRITIGYVCGEFRKHATTMLMCGVYEMHDRSRFRLLGFDNGADDGSDYRRRVVAAFDELIDISQLSDLQAAQAIRARKVDVLVNLNGYYGEGRSGVFALRPCAVQVNYLGFPGTLGTPCIDYLIADSVVIPAGSRAFYSEKIVSLPRCYQANDDRRQSAECTATRADYGLPEKGVVFCCFNSHYKITPQTFASWMRILSQVPQSVLWLIEDSPQGRDNLRRCAQQRGVAPDRLVFAGRIPLEEHLARHALADLFLDTLPYNAHTTASDALWAGLPVLTQTGTTFPGRVCTSLLLALGLSELVTASASEYEERALSLVRDPSRLAAVRTALQARRKDSPLFDTRGLTRHLETAYRAMWQRHRSGQAPAHFEVPS